MHIEVKLLVLGAFSELEHAGPGSNEACMNLSGCLREALRLHMARHQLYNQHCPAIVKPLAQQHCISERLFSVQASEHSSETSRCVLKT